MKPLVSIIMPVYNCENYIEESIRSILEQTYSHWELIIVNDGSTDNTADKIAKIQDKRIRLLHLEKHLGLTAAFTEGYKTSKGEFVIRHDGDDISVPTRLETQSAYLLNHPEIGMVSCLISCFTRDPLFIKDCLFIERIQNYYVTYEEIKKAALNEFVPILFPTLMIRRTLLDQFSSNKSSLSFDDHFELLLELMKISPIEKINTILYHYRRHNNAYHVTNQKLYEQYCAEVLKAPSLKHHLQYKDFYKDFNPSQSRHTLNENSPIRLLMLVDALNVGGTETHVLNITRKLLDLGVYVIVATSGGPMEGVLQSYGIKTIHLPIKGDYLSNKEKMGMIQLLKKVIDEHKINLIHCHLFVSMQLASELFRIYHVPYVITLHGLFYPNDILYSTCIQASNVIAVSEPVKKMLDSKLGNRVKDKVVVIPNSVSADLVKDTDYNLDVRKELHISPGAKILCYCSRIDLNKTEAARVFLFSFSQIIESFPNLHAVIIGDGSGKESLENEAKIINQMAHKEVVHVIGARVNVIPYYLKSAVIIGTARVALEGMMCKKPVIAMGNQGYTGIISDKNKDMQWKMYFGDHDALEKPSVSSLVKDIKFLMADQQRRKRLGEWGRTWCEDLFNADKIVNQIVEIYKKVLGQ